MSSIKNNKMLNNRLMLIPDRTPISLQKGAAQ